MTEDRSPDALYQATATGYRAVRRPDPRIAAQIAAAAGAGRVVNVGAGAGSYERETGVFAAVEPSPAMVRQRPAGAAPVVRGRAEALPLEAGCADVALAVLTIHHWTDLAAGVAEMRRVARRRVLVTWDPACAPRFWLARDYLPAALVSWDTGRFPPLPRLLALLPGATVQEIPIPHDCSDGFLGAYWRRPEALLSGEVRRGISSLAGWSGSLDAVWERLAADLRSGAWQARNAELAGRAAIDLG
jgi:SAM-dependent methyltransferase